MTRKRSVKSPLPEPEPAGRNHLRWCRAAAVVAVVTLLAILSIAHLRAALIAKPLEQLVLESDLIVVGALGDVTDYGRSGSGVLKVKEVLWGTDVPEQLAVGWERPTDIEVVGCRGPARKLPHPDEEDRVWLLVREGRMGTECDDYRQRRRPLAEKGKVIQLLEEMPAFARRSLGKRGRGRDPYVDLVFRNVAEEAVHIPRFSATGRRLVLAPGSRVVLAKRSEDWTEVEVQPIPGRIRAEEREATVRVPARSEYKVTFKPSRIFRLEKGMHYRLSFELAGFPSVKETSRVRLYIPRKKKK